MSSPVAITSDTTEQRYPPKPVKPLDNDCCGSGCTTCVFDLYDLDVARWKKNCKEIDNKSAALCDTEDVLSIYEYKKFNIVEVENVSSCVKVFVFEVPHGAIRLKCGQHLIARCFDDEGKCIIRPYTPVNDPEEQNTFSIAVKLYPMGKMSACMKQWSVGTSVEWRGPFGDCIYEKPHQDSSLLLLAGGTGITPMIQILHTVLKNEDDFTRVNLIYSVQKVEHIIMLKKLQEWNSYWNCAVCYCLTTETASTAKLAYGDKVRYSRIDASILQETIPVASGDFKVFICGTQTFNEELKDVVQRTYNVKQSLITCLS